MPELPDVAVFGRIARRSCLNKTVQSVELMEPAMAEGIGQAFLNRKVVGHQFTEILRHGKHLLLKSREGWLALHFGMSGSLALCRDKKDMPRYTRMLILFTNDALAYTSRRKLGRIEWTANPDEFIRSKKLGPDALAVEHDALINLLRKRRSMIKTALMNQELMAGIGNEYSDEILFQAGLHPRSSTIALSDDDWQAIYRKTHDILPEAEELLAGERTLPDDWLIRHRKKGESCPVCGGEIHREKIGGRGCYLCPHCQVLREP